MEREFLLWLRKKIAEKEIGDFYRLSQWKTVRRKTLEADKRECQHCKAKGFYSPAEVVHHVRHLEDYPELGLDAEYEENGQKHRNLISLCRDCHEREHGRNFGGTKKREPLTPERW